MQPLPITIRPATPADVDEVVRIYVESWNAGFGELLSQANRSVTPDLIERWSRDLALPIPHRWWVAERDDSTVGFVGICPSRAPVDPKLGEVDTIAVDPPYWRKGIGRELMSLALRRLASDGYSEATVWTVEHYERGIALYEAMGWRRDSGVRDGGRQICFRRGLAGHLQEVRVSAIPALIYLARSKYNATVPQSSRPVKLRNRLRGDPGQ